MPIYEYQCAACGQVVEKWQKISEAPLTACPVCGGGLSKLISSCAFHLKGSGWYVTDYSGSRNAASTSPAGDTTKTPAGESSAKPTETKEAEKAGTAAPKKFT